MILEEQEEMDGSWEFYFLYRSFETYCDWAQQAFRLNDGRWLAIKIRSIAFKISIGTFTMIFTFNVCLSSYRIFTYSIRSIAHQELVGNAAFYSRPQPRVIRSLPHLTQARYVTWTNASFLYFFAR